MIIEERQLVQGGGCGGGWHVRVRVLPDDEPIPEGAKEMPEGTPLHDWKWETE